LILQHYSHDLIDAQRVGEDAFAECLKVAAETFTACINSARDARTNSLRQFWLTKIGLHQIKEATQYLHYFQWSIFV
jgi:hypothetical protein